MTAVGTTLVGLIGVLPFIPHLPMWVSPVAAAVGGTALKLSTGTQNVVKP